jgi:hypothetical protein
VAAVSAKKSARQQPSRHCGKICTSHVRKLLATSLEILPVLFLHRIHDGGRNRVIHAEDGSVTEPDLPRIISLQSASAGHLTQLPCLGGVALARIVRGRCPAGYAKSHGRVCERRPRVRIITPDMRMGCEAGSRCTGLVSLLQGVDNGLVNPRRLRPGSWTRAL